MHRDHPEHQQGRDLGSINLVNHIVDGKLDSAKLERTVRTAVRMLDNVIDINYYSVPQAQNANFKHRPVGLGIMGFQDALYLQHIAYGSDAAIDFADQSMEAISYYAIQASCDLADERGAYSSFDGSLWSRASCRWIPSRSSSRPVARSTSMSTCPNRWTGRRSASA